MQNPPRGTCLLLVPGVRLMLLSVEHLVLPTGGNPVFDIRAHRRPNSAVAAGDKGQFIYVSPRKSLVIIRNGIDYGIPFDAWFDLFYRFANEL